MGSKVVTVLFSREGVEEHVPLTRERQYQVRVDGGPPSTFTSPWDQAELEQIIDELRNMGGTPPTIESARRIGRDLGEKVFRIRGLERYLLSHEPVTICWQIDYPELARIPWELATSHQRPYRHLLLNGISFVRKVPAVMQDMPAQWPTGRDTELRLLYVWGETEAMTVPHEQHQAELEAICQDLGIAVTSREVRRVDDIADICADGKEQPHFVHVLAHGVQTGDDEWGLRFRDQSVKGEQLARALRVGGATPAVVTLAACDSANEKDGSFGSVAYQLHTYGIPLVIASQFRLRKSVSVRSVATIYRSILSGGDVIQAMRDHRRRLSVDDNESWANEVLYSRYRQESLEVLSIVARQQTALRRARRISDMAKKSVFDSQEGFEVLNAEIANLKHLKRQQQTVKPRDFACEAETCGLLGSLYQRRATLDPDGVSLQDMTKALRFYEEGLRTDANSHYCGINVVHLTFRLGSHQKALEWIPLVRFATETAIHRGGDYWVYATAGDLEVYAGQPEAAADKYRAFANQVESQVVGENQQRKTLESSKGSLSQMVTVFDGEEHEDIRAAATASLKVLDDALRRLG